MDKRTAGMVGLVISILFCGLPGLCGLCFGSMFTLISLIPGAEIDIFGSSEPRAAITTGLVALCLSIIFIVIPVLVWFFTLREKPSKHEIIDYDTPMPNDM